MFSFELARAQARAFLWVGGVDWYKQTLILL